MSDKENKTKTKAEEITAEAIEDKQEANETAKENAMLDKVMVEVNKKIAEMFAEAEAKIKETEKVKAAAEGPGEMKEDETARINAELEEYVEVKLFKDNGKYKEDVFVCVNGDNCRIKRGVKVKIKKKFATVLEQSDMQDFLTSQLMDAKEAEYEASAKAHGII